MTEKHRKKYRKFNEIRIGKYPKYMRRFGAILHWAEPDKILNTDMGRRQVMQYMWREIPDYFSGNAEGIDRKIGGGSIKSLRAYALAWKAWIKNWPTNDSDIFLTTIDEICVFYDIGIVKNNGPGYRCW
jgi:hypothetical protein